MVDRESLTRLFIQYNSYVFIYQLSEGCLVPFIYTCFVRFDVFTHHCEICDGQLNVRLFLDELKDFRRHSPVDDH